VSDAADTTATGSADLVDLIRQQCATEIAELRSAATERAERARAAAAAESATLRAEARSIGEARGRQATATRLAVAETDSRRAWLWSREQLVEEVLETARARLAEFPNVPDGTRILHALVAEGLQALPPGPVYVRVSAASTQRLDSAACETLGRGRWQLTITTEGAPPAGVVVESDDGRLRFDNSFEARLRRNREGLRRLILETLLAGEMPEW